MRCLLPIVLALAPLAAPPAAAQARPASGAAHEERVVSDTARGTFTVTLQPLPAHDAADGSMLGRMSLDKEYSGGLAATAVGEMLTAMTPVRGSAAYVAVERVTGTLDGRAGSFVLQHSGTMAGGAQRLTIEIVPDSGTGDLAGIRGSLAIDIADGVHHYTLAYTLSATDR